MNLKNWFAKSERELVNAGVATARLDCLVLLEDALQKDRSWLLAHLNHSFHGSTVETLDRQVARRAKHEPLAYIRGKTEFYGREFKINKHVLEPRPESETMIDLIKGLELPKTPHIIDVGTGSGALGITVALEVPGSTVGLTDVDPKCLDLARQNQKAHKVTARLFQADLLNFKPRLKPDVILANLPYVPDKFTINEAAQNEPKIAIFGGPDGLDLYRKLFHQLKLFYKSHGRKENETNFNWVLTESLPFQHKELAKIARAAGYKLVKTNDFIQLFELI